MQHPLWSHCSPTGNSRNSARFTFLCRAAVALQEMLQRVGFLLFFRATVGRQEMLHSMHVLLSLRAMVALQEIQRVRFLPFCVS